LLSKEFYILSFSCGKFYDVILTKQANVLYLYAYYYVVGIMIYEYDNLTVIVL